MKVLHITYTDAGGAGIAAMRIHQSLRLQGIDSSMLVAEKTTNDDTVFTAESYFVPSYKPSRNKFIRKFIKIARKRGYLLDSKEHYEYLLKSIPSPHRTFFTSPLSYYKLHQHPAVIEADIIHLHWIANFIDYPSFFPTIKKPIVWTLHDENLAYGGFHYGREREHYYPYYASVEDAYCKIKQSSLKQCERINVVALSKMMKNFYTSRSFLSDRPTTIIHNGIDTDIFHPIDKSIGRKIYHIPENRYVIVFCCVSLNDKRKGLAELIDAIERLNREDITLICIGSGHIETKSPVDIRYIGPIYNPYLLAMTYSCGDMFAFPSFQEAFAQTPLEAISCGLPIVAFPCSGIEELVHEKNGIVSKDFSVAALTHSIKEVSLKTYDINTLHDDIVHRFNSNVIASQYSDLYNRVIRIE